MIDWRGRVRYWGQWGARPDGIRCCNEWHYDFESADRCARNRVTLYRRERAAARATRTDLFPMPIWRTVSDGPPKLVG